MGTDYAAAREFTVLSECLRMSCDAFSTKIQPSL